MPWTCAPDGDAGVRRTRVSTAEMQADMCVRGRDAGVRRTCVCTAEMQASPDTCVHGKSEGGCAQ